MRTWYIEDAGGGCRAFSEVLVLVSEEPLEIYTTKLPLTWKENLGMEEMSCQLMIPLLHQAGVTKSDHVLVCSGNIFHKLHQWLEKEGYNWEMAKMEGIAHDVAENAFYQQLLDAGLPAECQLVERDYRSMYRQVESWVRHQPNPEDYWKDRGARQKPVEARYRLHHTSTHPRKCRQCGKMIRPFSPLVEYRTQKNGKKIRLYFHPKCSPMKPLSGKLKTASVQWWGGNITGLILPGKLENAICPVCGKEILLGEATFYGYLKGKLIFMHEQCL